MNEENIYSRRVVKRQCNAWGKIAGFLRRLRMFNRRRAERFFLGPPVPCVFIRTDLGREAEHACFVYNISETGALLTTEEEKLIPGNEIAIRFTAPDSGGSIETIGEVVRTYRKKAQPWYYSAVRFRESEIEKARSFAAQVIAQSGKDKPQ